jgi:hypothetical protein
VLSEIKWLTAPARTRPRAPERRACHVGHVPCTLGSGVRMPRRLRGGPKPALGRSALSCHRAPRSGKPKRPGSGPGRATRRHTQHRASLRACRSSQLAVPRVLSRFATPRPPRVCAHAFVIRSRLPPTFLPAARAVAPHYRATALARLRSCPPPPKLFPSFL